MDRLLIESRQRFVRRNVSSNAGEMPSFCPLFEQQYTYSMYTGGGGVGGIRHRGRAGRADTDADTDRRWPIQGTSDTGEEVLHRSFSLRISKRS